MKPICLHCEITDKLNELFPEGLTARDASQVLQHLASVAGEILANAPDEGPMLGFFDLTNHYRKRGGGNIKFRTGLAH